jgi:hypothetical protein
MKKFSRVLSLAIATFSLLVAGATPAFAASQQVSGTGNGLKISPVRTDLTINPGESQSVTVYVQNVTSAEATFQALVNDFVAGNGETGEPALILDNNKYAPSHSLKRFISPVPNIVIAAGETKQIKVTITVPKEAAGGGYFGAVRFAPSSPNSGANQNVTLSASVGSLILVRVPGDIKDNLSISSFDVRKSATEGGGSSFYTSNKSLFAVVRFSNQGNVQEQPFGKIALKKDGKTLQTTEINSAQPKGNVLPNSIRRFNVPLNKVGSWGKYTIEGNFGYGDKGQLLSATSTFYVVPVLLIVAAVLLLSLLIAAIIVVPRSIRGYNQRILRRGGRR